MYISYFWYLYYPIVFIATLQKKIHVHAMRIKNKFLSKTEKSLFPKFKS